MSRQWPAIGTPWILALVENFGRTKTKPEPQLAQVLNFVKSKNNTFDNMLDPAAVVHIMDWHCYIQAVITKEAKTKMEREEEHFKLEDINNQVIILREFRVLFMQEKELPKCAFYIRIEHFNVMPVETDRRPDVMNCNTDPSVKWMIKENWKKYRDELVKQDRDSSDESLTQLLNSINEEKLTNLKKTAHKCLNLRGVAPLTNTLCTTTTWKTGQLRSKTNKRVFSVPIKWLIISPEEEEALDNLEEWRDDYQIRNDNHEADSCLKNFVIAEQPSDAQEAPTSSQSSQVSQVILRTEDDMAQPDSSTPDILEDLEGNLPDDLDRSQSSLFTDSNERGKEVFEDDGAVMCENLTSIGNNYCIDSGITCGQKSHYVNDDTINQSQLSSSDTSILLDMCYLDKESENTSFVSEQEKNTTPVLCSVIVNDSLSDSDILRSEEDEPIPKKCFGQSETQQAMKRTQPTEVRSTFVEEETAAYVGQSVKQQAMKRTQPTEVRSIVVEEETAACVGQSVKQQAMKRTQPTEVRSTFVEEETAAGKKEYAEKRPKKKDLYPLLESDYNVKTRAVLRKPELQFLSVPNNRDAQEATETSHRAVQKDTPLTPVVNCQVLQNSTLTTKAQERLEEDVSNQHSTSNMRHFDGSRLQYKYKAAGSALCTKVRSARLSEELLKWAFQVVFETEQEL